MSHGIIAYRVSLERLQSRIGIQDIAKRNKIKESVRRYAKTIDSLAIDAKTPKFMQMVEDLLEGKINHNKYGYIYWYAIKYFIEELGQSMQNGNWYPSSADIFFAHPEFILFGIDFTMKIPKPEDFPTVFVLDKGKMNDELINNLKERVLNVNQSSELISWIMTAKKYKQDLVLYYH